MHKRFITTLLLALSTLFLYGRDLSASNSSSFFVVVSTKNPIDSIDRKFLADVFLKKITHWPEDGVIQPIDLRPDAEARSRFSEEVLNRSVMGVKSYWQQLIFSGQNVPPPELRNDDEVIQYIIKNSGSIGYISISSISAVSSGDGVKMIDIK